MALSGSICGNPRVLRLFGSDPLWLPAPHFPQQRQSLTPPLAVCPLAARSQAFLKSTTFSPNPEQSWQAPATPPHMGELQGKEQLPHVKFEYVPYRKQDALRPIHLPIATLTNAIPLPSPEEKNTSWKEL